MFLAQSWIDTNFLTILLSFVNQNFWLHSWLLLVRMSNFAESAETLSISFDCTAAGRRKAHHWRSHQSSLVASSRAHQVGCCADVRGSLQHCAALPWATRSWYDIPGWRALRSAVTDRLTVPSARLHTVGNKAFPVAARKSGTVCRTISYLLHPSLPSVVYLKLFV